MRAKPRTDEAHHRPRRPRRPRRPAIPSPFTSSCPAPQNPKFPLLPPPHRESSKRVSSLDCPIMVNIIVAVPPWLVQPQKLLNWLLRKTKKPSLRPCSPESPYTTGHFQSSTATTIYPSGPPEKAPGIRASKKTFSPILTP